MTDTIPKRRGRPRKTPPATVVEPDDDDLIGGAAPEPDEPEPVSLDLSLCYGGVSCSWLAQMFGADKNTIKKKLAQAGIEVVGQRNGGPLYRLPDAAPYLVKPKVDLVAYIKSLRPNDLPPMLNEAYWSAMIKRQKWEENAGDLWRTADVLDVLGSLNTTIRDRVRLWADEVEREGALTQAQREALLRQSDNLLLAVHKALVDMPKSGNTPSSIAEEGAIPEQGLEGAE